MNDPAQAATPGQWLQALLEERGWNQRVLAVVLGVDVALINRTVSDKRPIDAALAIKLGEVFDQPAERFLDAQSRYDLAHARVDAKPDPRRALRAKLFGDLPVTEMIKRRWIDAEDVRDTAKVEAGLAHFFGTQSSDSVVEMLPHAARKTAPGSPTTAAQLAWIVRVKQIAGGMLVGKSSTGLVREALTHLRTLLLAPEEARKVPRILAECGIRFVIVESLPSAKIDGVCLWLNDWSPVIGLSMRHDRVDNFWFVLRHEIEHVLCGHGRASPILDTELEGERAGVGKSVSDEERVANAAAAEFCVPQAQLSQFIDRKAPFFAERDMIGFARTLRIHPGLVAGQLQHKTGRYDRFRAHQVKMRSIVAPSATVDGWGDVAPVD